MNESLKFHWALPVEAVKSSESQADLSGTVDIGRLVDFCQAADDLPIDSLLTPFGFHMPDPIPLVGMLSARTKRVGFMLAYRAGLLSPTLFVQSVNTLSQLMPNRILLNVLAGISPDEQAYYGDHLTHDERYVRSEEFLDVCIRLWNDEAPVDFEGKYIRVVGARLNTRFHGKPPQIYLSGNSKAAERVASGKAFCRLRYGDTVERIGAALVAAPMRTGLRLSVISRETREEAALAAYRVVENPDLKWKEFIRKFVENCDSVAVKSTYELSDKEWLAPNLWAGAVPFRGGPALSLVGTHEEVAREILRYKAVGIREFILSGWPSQDEMKNFCANVLPLVRATEGEKSCQKLSA